MLSYAPTLLGSTTPRIFTPPLVTGPPGPCGCGCALTPETSKGFSALEFAKNPLGIGPLPWQRWLLIHALELRPDGRFRFRTVIVLVARQNGKTTIVEVKNLWKMFILGVPLVIGTAQDLDMAEESWEKAVEIVESIPELDAEKAHVDKTNGKKTLRLANGSRWKIKAASRKAGRGLAGDDVNLDELREHQTWLAWAAVSKTTMARPNPQVWAFSNAGDALSVVLNSLQDQGRAAVEHPDSADPSLGLFEWSAPDDVKCTCGRPGAMHTADCRLQDRRAWAQANPALGYTVTEEAIASALTTDPEPVFRAEVLCQRVPDLRPEWSVIPEAIWRALAEEEALPVDPVALAVHVASDRRTTAVAAAWRRADGLLHVEVVRHNPGTGWVVADVLGMVGRNVPCALVLDPGSQTGSLIPELEAGLAKLKRVELEITKTSAREVTQAVGQFYDAVKPTDGEPTLRYTEYTGLTLAVAGADKRTLGDAWAWDRKNATVDLAPLEAGTLAAWGFVSRPVEQKPPPAGPSKETVDKFGGNELFRPTSRLAI